MDEYVYKNSPREKPEAIRLFEHKLEWQCGEKKIYIPYVNIVALNLNKRTSIYITRIVSDFQGTLVVTNRFYLSNGEFEDRSRQYNTFVRLLHFHLNKQVTTTFLVGAPVKTLIFILATTVIASIALQWAILKVVGSVHVGVIIVNAVVFFTILLKCVRSFPRPYRAPDIPFNFLPSAK